MIALCGVLDEKSERTRRNRTAVDPMSSGMGGSNLVKVRSTARTKGKDSTTSVMC